MNIYTVSFFGHRYIERGTEIEERLDKLLHDLITQKEYVDFLIGWNGNFDLLASAAIKRAVRSYNYGNTHFTLVLPYMKAEYRANEKEYLDYLMKSRCVLNCPKRTRSLLSKSAIGAMIDRSDLVVCCIQHKSGVAYRTIQYAEKQGKKIVNLAEKTE